MGTGGYGETGRHAPFKQESSGIGSNPISRTNANDAVQVYQSDCKSAPSGSEVRVFTLAQYRE